MKNLNLSAIADYITIIKFVITIIPLIRIDLLPFSPSEIIFVFMPQNFE